MCLIAIAWKVHPRYRLALIANRDESHARPTAPAGVDPDANDVYGGRDLQAGGGWLQVSTRGRLAAVTNVRAGLAPELAARSRGALVRDFVRGGRDASDYASRLRDSAPEYGRFNLLVHAGDILAFASNYPEFAMRTVAPGVHAMSNGAFDAPWPKSGHATGALSGWLASPAADADIVMDAAARAPLFLALTDTAPAPDAALPDTGVGLALERVLSPAFVRGETYGTRCSSVVLLSDTEIVFVERRYGPDAVFLGETAVTMPIRVG